MVETLLNVPDEIHGELDTTLNGKLNISQTSYKGKNVVVDSSTGDITFENKPSIPSASSTTPSADTVDGAVGNGTTWARSNHVHPKSSIYAEASHSHTISDLPTANSITNGDTSHVVSADVIYDYIDTVIGDADDWLTS